MDQALTGETLVARTARALARLSLDSEKGAYLGAEQDLLARLGISRPTLRQAAKIVESDRLISVRRGTHGGFYAERPDAADAIRTLTRFLRLRGTTLRDIMAMNRLVFEEAAALACACAKPELRSRLEAFVATIDANDTPGAVIRAETKLARLIAEMSGNPAIELVLAIGYGFGLEEQGVAIYHDPAERTEARKLQHDLCRSILDNDAEIARLMMRRRSAMMALWIDR
jgi:GntR family transcriptional repressor for pyruvate dehydrogenase complex